jgi:SPP1 family predicted phage head-tail adaptor
MSLKIGNLDRRITFQMESFERNEFNEKITTWVNFKTVWAHVISTPGNEAYIADQLTAVLTMSFMIRYRTDIDIKMRVVYNGAVYKVVSITEPEGTRREFLRVKTEQDYEAMP